MDAKNKANFINSITLGQDASNSESGAELSGINENNAPAFAPAVESVEKKSEDKYVEPINVFAQGLPSWSIEPPQVLVRRR